MYGAEPAILLVQGTNMQYSKFQRVSSFSSRLPGAECADHEYPAGLRVPTGRVTIPFQSKFVYHY